MIVTNTTFHAAPWADALCAMDYQWWKRYGAEAKRVFQGQLVSPVRSSDAKKFARIDLVTPCRNSGAGALMLAKKWGAKRILMLGYDCQHTGGRTHHHGNHPHGLGNAGSVAKWPGHFQQVAREMRDVQVINCTRQTALAVFPCAALESSL